MLEEPRYRRSDTPGKLTPFHDAIKQALKVDAHRPRHERRTARALHAQIKAEGYAGGYSRVTDFVRAWRQGEGQSVSIKAFVPLAFELGARREEGSGMPKTLKTLPCDESRATCKTLRRFAMNESDSHYCKCLRPAGHARPRGSSPTGS